MTPATALESPPLPELELEPDDDGDDNPVQLLELEPVPRALGAHTPVLFPQALHQLSWSPIAIFCMPATKLFHGMTVWLWPKSGYAVGTEMLLVVPLWKRKRTPISLADGYEVEVTVAFVTNSQVNVLA